MFDVGFWEVALIGVIALLVVGPERLPALARNVGRYVGMVRRYVTHVKQDIEREIHADEVRELINRPGSLKDGLGDGLGDLKDVARETSEAVTALKRNLESAARDGEGEGMPAASDTTAGDAQAETPAASIPHHAVDDDPFAPPAGESPAPTTEAPAAVPGASEDHEQAVGSQRRD